MQPPLFPDDSQTDRLKPLVLLLGNVDHEGITSLLKSGGEQYKKKLLTSSPDNWKTILDYFKEFTIRAVVVKLNAHVYDLLASAEYKDIAQQLFEQIATVRHVVFAFEDLLSAQEQDPEKRAEFLRRRAEAFGMDDEDDVQYYFDHFAPHNPATKVLTEINQELRKLQLNLVPYRTNAEVTVIAAQVLQDALDGLLFRIYVPVAKLWADEIDRLLQLFRDYLLRTGRKGIRLDQIRTDHGTSYEFHGDDAPSASSLSEDFQDFSHFLDLCLSSPGEAEALLRQKSVDPREIAQILTRYSKEAKRLQVDLRHERERKLLSIRQKLESELADLLPSDADWTLIGELVASAIPDAYSVSATSVVDQRYLRAATGSQGSPLTINLRPQIIQTVNGVIAQEIRGDVNISEDEERLLQLIREHGGRKSVELTTAVQVLSDAGISKSDRLASAQKLKSFVFSVAGRVGAVGTTLLTEYLEKKLGLK